jgi:hypothetical protein
VPTILLALLPVHAVCWALRVAGRCAASPVALVYLYAVRGSQAKESPLVAEDLIISNATIEQVAAMNSVDANDVRNFIVPHTDQVDQIFAFIEREGLVTLTRIENEAVPGQVLNSQLVEYAACLYVCGGQGLRITRA